MGLNNAEEYYKLLELKPKISKIKVPTLFIFSEDDPFSEPSWVPVEEINKSKYAVFLTTPEGGHTGFFQGWNTKVSYSEEVSLDFCNTFPQDVNKFNAYKAAGDMVNYEVIVHALKSNCRTLGFMNTGEMFYQHELASKRNDMNYINELNLWFYDQKQCEASVSFKINYDDSLAEQIRISIISYE